MQNTFSTHIDVRIIIHIHPHARAERALIYSNIQLIYKNYRKRIRSTAVPHIVRHPDVCAQRSRSEIAKKVMLRCTHGRMPVVHSAFILIFKCPECGQRSQAVTSTAESIAKKGSTLSTTFEVKSTAVDRNARIINNKISYARLVSSTLCVLFEAIACMVSVSGLCVCVADPAKLLHAAWPVYRCVSCHFDIFQNMQQTRWGGGV